MGSKVMRTGKGLVLKWSTFGERERGGVVKEERKDGLYFSGGDTMAIG